MIINTYNHETGIVSINISGKVTYKDLIEWIHMLTPVRFPIKDLKVVLNATDAEP